jgi:TonB family protein
MNMNRTLLAMTALMLTSMAFGEIRVTMSDAMKAATTKVQPAYSPVARQMKVAGKVEVEATIDEAGSVETVKALNGNPLLTQSALAAVQKWKFTPFTADGKASKAIVTLSFDFKP